MSVWPFGNEKIDVGPEGLLLTPSWLGDHLPPARALRVGEQLGFTTPAGGLKPDFMPTLDGEERPVEAHVTGEQAAIILEPDVTIRIQH